LFDLNTTGLRFFTVYGPWGRPDMAMYIFANKIFKGESIDVYNHGDMNRDFTYIDDIIRGIRYSLDKNYKNEVFNLGNNKSEKLMDVVKYLENYLGMKAKVEFKPMQPGDVKSTSADIERSRKLLGYNPTINIDIGIKNFIDWYKSYNSI
ncbi:NAD-dependent epimerase/dehydratase family protein, partial [Candidatus Marinimicrobia bacterium]|nr:NAD-dependent epimerase/dehydratase family protein [Candidatus Neomarinimicrobiota bacterium]